MTVMLPAHAFGLLLAVFLSAGLFASPVPARAAPEVLLAVGDIAFCERSWWRQLKDWLECYDHTWGRHKARSRPVPGNHEINTAEARPYFDY